MKISEVYKKFGIPPVLQNHMINVAEVCSYILDHWGGVKINRKKLIFLCLVHDLGNLVRIDFNKQFGPREEWLDIKLWSQIKVNTINKYGNDDDTVTAKMLEELGVAREISEIIFKKRFVNSIKIANSDNWLLKLLLYSDLRVLPTGIGTLQQRLDEVLGRRKDLSKKDNISLLCDACRKIERDIQKYVNISLESITDLKANKKLFNTIVLIQ